MSAHLQKSDLPAWIANDIQEYMDANSNMEEWPLSKETAFEYYCEWNGICGWAGKLSRVMEALGQ